MTNVLVRHRTVAVLPEALGSARACCASGRGTGRRIVTSGGQLLDCATSLEERQMIHEQGADQVVHLVLQADRRQSTELGLLGVAVAIEAAYANLRGSLHFGIQSWQGQTAFLHDADCIAAQDLWIDEDARRFGLPGSVQYDHLQMDIDLGSGQTDALRRLHRFHEIIDESGQAGIEPGHRFGDLAQAWVWVFEDLETRHGDYRRR